MAVNKYWMVYVGIFVPLFLSILSIVLVLVIKPRAAQSSEARKCTEDGDCQHNGKCVNGACQCTPQWTGDRCQVVAVPPTAIQAGSAQCGATPVTCAADSDCAVCGGDTPFKCTQVAEGDTPFNLTGTYCLPVKPEDSCNQDPGAGKYNQVVPGKYMWQGWKDVETQKWTCTCEYPLYYPPALGTGACTKSQELCAFGKWHFPCKGKSCNLSPTDQEQLKNASPLERGYCQCSDVPCSSNSDCASNKCKDGVCVGQRLGLNPRTGLPQCVPDACAPFGKWKETDVPPYVYGRCDCPPGTLDNGDTCVSDAPPPADPVCPKNCSNNGACLASGKCVCKPGYSGEACDQFTCSPNLCYNRGKCIGPNTCQCALGLSYNPTTQLCDPQVTCAPPPAVQVGTGLIENSDKFSIARGTACGGGSPAQLDALCQAAGYDKAQGSSACFKKADCSRVLCDEAYCGKGVTDVVGPISKEVAEDGVTCINPSADDVQAMCAMHGYGYTNLFLVNGAYQCVQFEAMNNIHILTLKAEEGLGLEGSMCISFDDANIAKQRMTLDGNDLFASYQVYVTSELNSLGDEGQGAAPFPSPVANKMLFLKRLVPPADQPCNGYLYSFSDRFLSTDPILHVKPGTPLSIIIRAYPSSRWTCKQASARITECTAAYLSPVTKMELLPYTPEPGISPVLTPQLRPDLAYQLATNAGWVQTAFTSNANIGPDVAKTVNVDELKTNTLLVAPPPIDSPVVQGACTAAYCSTGGDVGKKLIIMAWENIDAVSVGELGLTCSALASQYKVKYNLIRTAPQGELVSLVGPGQTLSTYTVGDKQVAYFIDVLPANVHAQYHYTLTAYAATDARTTYETSQCKSPEQTITVVVDPYSESFCQSMNTGEPNKLPPYAWLQNGVCHWEENNVPAIDYYCAVNVAGNNTEFPITKLQLADGSHNCSVLQSTYPSLDKSKNWALPSCDPTYGNPAKLYACVSVKFSPSCPYIVNLFEFNRPGMKINNDSELQVSPGTLVPVPRPPLPYRYLVVTYYISRLAPSNVITTSVTPAGLPMQFNRRADLDGSYANKACQLNIDVTGVMPSLINGQVYLIGLQFNARVADGFVTIQQLGYTNEAVPMTSTIYARQCSLTPYGTMSFTDCRNSCSYGLGALGVSDTTCLPTTPTGIEHEYSAAACKGLQETREVTCHTSLPFEGQGSIANLSDFTNRMHGLYGWYKEHHLDAGMPPVKNISIIAGEIGTSMTRNPNETDEQFALRVWSSISGDETPGTNGYLKALTLVKDKTTVTCADYQPLCDLALTLPYANQSAVAFGCGAPCNSQGSTVLYNQYYHCGPAQLATTYGYNVNSCTDGNDTVCDDLLQPIRQTDGTTTCDNLNMCSRWELTPGTDTYNPVYTQTRTCFPSKLYESTDSPCCECKGTYSVDRRGPVYTPACECDANMSCNAYLQ